ESEKMVAVDDNGRREVFDALILAAPIETAELDFDGLTAHWALPERRELQTADATCVAGRLSPSFFGLSSETDLPQLILTTENRDTSFSFINLISLSGNRPFGVYKIQSRAPLDNQLLSKLFVEKSEVLKVHWKAYPVLTPTKNASSFKVRKGLYYVNAMESVVSTLETEAVAARNGVELLKRDFA